jgi:hypothetical protein
MMGKQARKIIAVLLTLVLAFSALPMTAGAQSSDDYMRVTKNNSYNKNGMFYASYTVKNVTNWYLTVIGQYLSPSGKVIKTFNPMTVDMGGSGSWDFGMDFAGYPGGNYTFKLNVYVGSEYTAEIGYHWITTITRTVPAPSFSFRDYETYYNKSGVLIHKLSVNCKNLKGQRLYLKIYDEYGYLVGNWGDNETSPRKTNDEIVNFTWTAGWSSGNPFPSGNYTFVFSNSANNKTISETLWLMIPQKGVG